MSEVFVVVVHYKGGEVHLNSVWSNFELAEQCLCRLEDYPQVDFVDIHTFNVNRGC